MRTLAERAATAPPPSSAEGTIFYDDFASAVAGSIPSIAYAIRDLATYLSPAIQLPSGTARPSAAIQNFLNQQVTVRWQLSGDGSIWVDGDAGTVVAAGAYAAMAPNSVRAPYMRLSATAAIAPTTGTLYIYSDVPTPRWAAGGLGEAIVSCRAGAAVLAGTWAMSLKTRVRGAAINDSCDASLLIPLSVPSPILELGALVALDAAGSTAKQFDLLWNDVYAGNQNSAFGLRYETPQVTGTLSIMDSAGAWISLAKPRLLVNSSAWADLRVAVDPGTGRYVYVAFNGEVLESGRSGYASTVSPGYGGSGQLMMVARTLAAASSEVLIDRVWVRAIS